MRCLKNNKKGSEALITALVFLGLWFVTSFIWAWWLDGILVPIAGAITSGIASGGVSFVFHSN